jgi:HicB family
MGTLTIRLPDEKHEKLRQLATRRKISINKLIEELSTIALTDFDAETRFRARAALGSPREGLRLLDRLDHQTTAGQESNPGRKGRRR